MSTMFGARPNSQKETEYTSVSVQTSSQGLAIPLVYGQSRIGTNLIWLENFQAHPAKGGGKGGKGGAGGKGGGSGYTYTAAVALGLCEGPIEGVGTIWADSNVTTLGSLDLSLYTGTASQTPPAYIESNYPSQAVSYANTAFVFSSNYNLGGSPSVPNHNFEILGFLNGTMPGTPDVNMADVIPDYITNPQYGLDPSATYIDAASLAQFKTYLTAQGIFMSPALDTQEQATQAIQRWAQLTNSWIFWNGTKLVFVPLGDTELINNGVTYAPQLTPIYALDVDDFLFDPTKNEQPVTVTRIDPADGYNNVQLDTRDRGNEYNSNPLRYDDQTSEDQYGVLQSQVVQADEICDPNVGQIVAFLIGKRSVYIRNNYEWKGADNLILLEPGDIVTLTDPGIGLSAQPVRITSVSEDDKGILKFAAEEFPGAIGQAVLYPPQSNAATGGANLYADPGSINAPAIFEPSPVVTNGQPELWIAASGGAQWGGCQVYVSPDGLNYAYLGLVSSACAQGTLTAGLTLAADPDLTGTIAVDLTESGLALATAATDAMANAFQTVALIDSEMIAYGSVVATGAETFDLSYLRRGVYGTTPAAHTAGAAFSRIDPTSVFSYALTQAYIGVPLYFKFPSFNTFGNSAQSIADVPAYEYTPSGVAFAIAPPTGAALASGRTTQADGTTVLSIEASWTASVGPMLGNYEVQISSDGGTSWPVDIAVASAATAYTLAPATAGTNYRGRVRAISQSGLAQSAWDETPVLDSGALVASVPAAPGGLALAPISGGFVATWTPSSDTSILSYQVWIAAGASEPFGSASLSQTVSAPATSATVLGLAASEISVFVVAVNAAGSSAPAG